jgi:mRNA interferase HicA
MKRVELVRFLQDNGCRLLREGGRHSVFVNEVTGKVSTVPRHREINDFLARKICKDLELPSPI